MNRFLMVSLAGRGLQRRQAHSELPARLMPSSHAHAADGKATLLATRPDDAACGGVPKLVAAFVAY